ncbi:hypothetical protein AB751O23_AP_00120 [Chlamydiales bacterium SCGC AB-751-O23]|jgi:TPR repeat protein|nr:hypothetical protein AB751O23_AP_00120 [Chlamydiales bacterium SCGC AB-751-O23]
MIDPAGEKDPVFLSSINCGMDSNSEKISDLNARLKLLGKRFFKSSESNRFNSESLSFKRNLTENPSQSSLSKYFSFKYYQKWTSKADKNPVVTDFSLYRKLGRKARKLYKKAAEIGEARAAFLYGRDCLKISTGSSVEEAIHYLELAASQGDNLACLELAKLYDPNLENHYNYYYLEGDAKEFNFDSHNTTLEEAQEKGLEHVDVTSDFKDNGLAFKYYKRAADGNIFSGRGEASLGYIDKLLDKGEEDMGVIKKYLLQVLEDDPSLILPEYHYLFSSEELIKNLVKFTEELSELNSKNEKKSDLELIENQIHVDQILIPRGETREGLLKTKIGLVGNAYLIALGKEKKGS